MKQKEKSLNDVWKQQIRCNDNYQTFDNTKKGTEWLKVMFKIANFYMSNIVRQIMLNYPDDKAGKHDNEKFSYAVRSYMPDTSLEAIRSLEPLEKKGLYVEINGEKITPKYLWFGIDTRLFREDGIACGHCYYHYDNALHPVFLPDGTRYREPQLSNVSADYKDGIVCNFYRE